MSNKQAMFILASVLLLVSGILFLNAEKTKIEAEYECLLQEKAELQVDYFKLQIQRDEAIDDYWQLNNQLMKEEAE